MVVTKQMMRLFFSGTAKKLALLFIALTFSTQIFAAVLPDERVDLLGHMYTGGGITVAGPAILVRKNLGRSLSVSGKYYIDMVSSASIDIYSQASNNCDPCYREKRIEKNLGFEYLNNRTTYSFGYTTSDENDYHSKTYNMGVAQTFFGDLTTISFGTSYGDDIVGRNGAHPLPERIGIPDPNFHQDKERRKYNIGISQILTRNLIAEIDVESGSEQCLHLNEGESCLNNPYRQVRYADASLPSGQGFESEIYPLTHNTDAIGMRAMYHLPWAATVRLDGRTYSDSWGIKAQNAEIRYVQTLFSNYLVEAKYRVYTQTKSSFYSDLFPFRDSQTFKARDKEMGTFDSQSFGLGVTYKVPYQIPFVERSTVNFYWDHMHFDYKDFRDFAGFMTKDDPKQKNTVYKVGEEPLYKLDSEVFRLFISFWY